MRIGSNTGAKNIVPYSGPVPQFGKVYVVADCWDTDIGPQWFPVGFGATPIIHGRKTGWACKYFRKLDEIKAENKEPSKKVARILCPTPN